MTERFVLDAWAILALLQWEEPAAARVKALLEVALTGQADLAISIISLGEVVYRVGKIKGEPAARETLAELQRLPLESIPASDKLVWAAVKYPSINSAVFYFNNCREKANTGYLDAS